MYFDHPNKQDTDSKNDTHYQVCAFKGIDCYLPSRLIGHGIASNGPTPAIRHILAHISSRDETTVVRAGNDSCRGTAFFR